MLLLLFLLCFQGRQQWSLKMPADIMAIEVLDYKAKSLLGLLVALSNCEIHTYVDKTHVDTIVTEDVVTAMKFGRFGREDSTLVIVTRGHTMALSFMYLKSCLLFMIHMKLFPGRFLTLNFNFGCVILVEM